MVNSPGQPVLRIKVLGNRVTVTWPVDVTGYVLEDTDNLNSGVWTQSVGTINDTATEHTYPVRNSGVVRIYRLRQANP